jgi:hypothetical protein
MNTLNVLGNPIITDNGMSLIFGVLLDGSAAWDSGTTPPVLHLYAEDVPLTPQTVLADLTEAAFSGYATVPMDALVNSLNVDGIPTMENLTLAVFEAAVPLTLEGQAAGYYWTDADGTKLLAVERFDALFPVDEQEDRIAITGRLLLRGLMPVPAS